ncbi:hypothetical protein P4H65_03885 [Paenibacillus chitinolyticus]|uniref:hypothetical protein n=1 Tax=Paenibacillus chitinolyticus TaxID=79263 RepID=UPI002DBDC148|nr:hypothetical protein [Paenibacillus chitinolyticus]MEC0244930.1 hypothetical protein [Paenibacillus chitinolyticus]
MNNDLILWSPQLKREIRSEKLKNRASSTNENIQKIIKEQTEKIGVRRISWF